MALQEVVAELNWLKSQGVVADYAICGAIAADIYIEPRSTLDVDVFVILKNPGAIDDMGTVWSALVSRGATWDGPYLQIGGWPVQLLGQGTLLEQEAIVNSVDHPFGKETGRVMTAHHLAAIALAVSRPEKDISRIASLLRSKQMDRAALMDLIVRFNLEAKWEAFQTLMGDGRK